MKNIYCIGGLGADSRIFQNINIPNHNLVFVEWIPPYKNESLDQYSSRLFKSFAANDINIIIGVSFGGMIAVELSRLTKVKTIILISSAKTSSDLPIHIKLGKLFNICKIISFFPFTAIYYFSSFLFGLESPSDRKIFKNIILDSDKSFLTWASCQIAKWKFKKPKKNIISIHGTSDRILPFSRSIHHDYIIKKGGHFMIFNKSKEINSILNDILNKRHIT